MTTELLIIDVQEGLFTPPPADAAGTVARINQLSERARRAGVPVVVIQHHTPDDELRHGSAAWQVFAALKVAPGDHRVDKTTPDSFLRTSLGALLIANGVSQLVVCGYSTPFCIDTTVRSAAAHGYPVTLAADAHTCHDKPYADGLLIRTHHNETLSNIESFGVPIRAVPAADIVF
ncbi:TPA: cysteine hydrolase [Serratia marcescens]|nr:cysteine hydrolase [Serratia marcescens]